MAFDKTKLNPIGGMSRRGNGSALWTYITEDAANVVDDLGYFNQVSGMLSVGDLIITTITANNLPVEVGIHAVMSNAGGVVNASNVIDLTTTPVTNTD